LLRLKPNWRPNNILSDDAKIHVEMSHHQDSSEYLNDKMYDMNAIGNLPFVNFALGFRHDRQQLTVMNTETMSIFFYYKLPCVVHVFNPDMIEAEPRFINEIDKILEQTVDDKKYKQLCDLFNEYGHGYATKVVLGGYQIRVQREQSDETYDEDEREERVNGNFELACNEVGLGLGLDWSRIRTSIGQQLMNSLTRDSSVIGGNSLESDINEWCKTLSDPTTWRIIEYQCIEPVYKLLDSERQRKIQIILDEYEQLEQQRTSRCRKVPDKLIFYPEEGLYKFEVQLENYYNSDDHLSSQSNDLFSFFYSPSVDRWYWACNKLDSTSWNSLKCTDIDKRYLTPVRDIMYTLWQTNPKPTDDIVTICSQFEHRYIPNATLGVLITRITNLMNY
jgi:hypothetical protein